MSRDRLTEPLSRFVKGTVPGIDYLTTYRAKVVRQSSNGRTVDIIPDDKRLPAMSAVPLRLGLPGVQVLFKPGAFVQVGWSNGSPQEPWAGLFGGGEPDSTKLVFNALLAFLGGEAGAEPPVKGISYRTAEDLYFNAVNAAIAALGTGLTALGYGGAAGAVAAVAAAAAAFQAGSTTYLATRAKVA